MNLGNLFDMMNKFYAGYKYDQTFDLELQIEIRKGNDNSRIIEKVTDILIDQDEKTIIFIGED